MIAFRVEPKRSTVPPCRSALPPRGSTGLRESGDPRQPRRFVGARVGREAPRLSQPFRGRLERLRLTREAVESLRLANHRRKSKKAVAKMSPVFRVRNFGPERKIRTGDQ